MKENSQDNNNLNEQRRSKSTNIWGWKFSMISLVFIISIILLMWYRHVKLDVAFTPSEIHTEESLKEKNKEK